MPEPNRVYYIAPASVRPAGSRPGWRRFAGMNNSDYETASVSLTGDREVNQDRFGVFGSGAERLLLVADGMGGYPRGETAAELLTEYAEESFGAGAVRAPEAFLRELIDGGHHRIQDFGHSQNPPIQPGSTVVAVLVQPQGLTWAHAGDSRLYRLHGGVLTRTRDHSYVQQLVDRGELFAAEAQSHPLRNYVTQCLGRPGAAPEASFGSAGALAPGDALLLCTDGFWGGVETTEIKQLLAARGEPLQAGLGQLAARAADATRPGADNVTALALRR